MSTLDRVALIGLPGSGKSTVAPLLAQRLGWPWVDTDAEVEAATGRSIHDLVARGAEPALRAAEAAALAAVLARDGPLVISCGGGLVTREDTRRALLDAACVACLDAPDAVLATRLAGGNGRPLLGGDPERALPGLRSARAGAHAAAHLRLPASAAPDAVAAQLACAVRSMVRVRAGGTAHHVTIASGALDAVVDAVPATAHTVVLVSDRAVNSAARRVRGRLRSEGLRVLPIALTGGERVKTWAGAGRLLQRMARAGVGRADCLVALGGGTVGDVAGFAAATYMRGIPWLVLPTTLLAMVDSAVGGKTGVDLSNGKNLAGAFWQPRAVLCDPSVLRTLPQRARRSALAEVVKYAMTVSPAIAEPLEQSLDRLIAGDEEVTARFVRLCCEAKAVVVEADERDAGRRSLLNYGHTAGHALEAATGYSERLTHGEAVAVGMRVAGLLSTRVAGCPAADIAWQDGMLRRAGLGEAPAVTAAAVMRRLGADKKAAAGRPRWVLLSRRGEASAGHEVSSGDVAAALREVLGR